MALLEIISASKSFGAAAAVDNVSLAVESGEFFALLGPSGCGKTTLLRMIAGFEAPTAGVIRLEDQDVSRVPPYKRNVNTVFQSYALFPHMSVWDNVAFGPKAQKVGGDETKRRVGELLDVVRLTDFAHRKPSQLSGGQQQLVGVARAMIANPQVILADEPTGNLHSDQGKEIMELFRKLNDAGTTIIQVTHSDVNASYGSRVIHLRDGWIVDD